MQQIDAKQVTPQLWALFDPDTPSPVRCFAVLDGQAAGTILTDNPDQPTWGSVYEATEGTVYLGGTLTAPLVAEIVERLLQQGDVLVGMWQGDERFALLPPNPDYDGFTLDFQDRPIGEGLAAYLTVPEGCEMRRVDAALFEHCANRDYYVTIFGSAERALEAVIGICLMRGDTILSEAFGGFMANNTYEIGAETHEPYRGQGYGIVTCAHVIHACETKGYKPYWNCAAGNLPSAALARKLDYRRERQYRLLAWARHGSKLS
jgi:RimJ/RimL family protein N-acetyltransferase